MGTGEGREVFLPHNKRKTMRGARSRSVGSRHRFCSLLTQVGWGGGVGEVEVEVEGSSFRLPETGLKSISANRR